MKTRKHFRGLFIFLSAFIIFFTASFVSSFPNNIMKAEVVIDDGPSGEKIVDIGRAGNVNYAINEKGEVYSWGSDLYGGLGQGSGITSSSKPKKVLNAINENDGNTHLTGIRKIYVCLGGVYAVKDDGTLYVWGYNWLGQLGILGGKGTSVFTPVKLSLPFIPKDVVATNYSVLILTESGEVYSAGSNGYATLGTGDDATLENDTFKKVELDNLGNSLPKIKEIGSTTWLVALLTEDGRILEFGLSMGTSNDEGGHAYFPTQALYQDKTEVNNIKEFVVNSNPFMGGAILVKDVDNTLFRSKSDRKHQFYNPLITPSLKVTDPYRAFPNFDNFASAKIGGGNFIYNNQIYFLNPYDGTPSFYDGTTSYGFDADEYIVSKYSEGAIEESYDNAKKVIALSFSANKNALVLSNDGGVFQNGKKVSFGDVVLKATKADSSIYNSMDKYNDNVTLTITPTNNDPLSNVRYYETDLITGVKSAVQTPTATTMNIVAEEGKRVYKQYDFFIDGKEADTTTSFTFDLYKKALDINGITNNGKYVQGSSFTLGSNGFSENIVTGKLTKPDTTVVDYVSGTPINDLGNYTLDVVDQYGNANSYAFTIVDTQPAESITFTKSASGDLVYDDTITKVNNVVGSLSLVYPVGQDTSTIKTLSIESGHDGANFEVVNSNELKVIGTQLEAREYTISLSGTDQNDMPFSGDVSFTVDKAIQSMTWDNTSVAYGTNGVSFGDTMTLGVKDLLGTASVTYSLKAPNSCITLTGNKASITCIPNPATVTFVATPSADSNYDNKPIELPVTISKKAITLQVELLDASTYKNDVSIHIGDALPTQRITSSDASVDVSSLGTPTFTYKKDGATIANPANASGVYTVHANYPTGGNADNYTITVQPATLRVEDISIDPGDYSDYFSITSGGNPYTIGTWTKDSIIITPVHSTFTKLDVNDGTPSASAYTYQVEGDQSVKLTFSTITGAKVSINVNLKVDTTKPVMQNNTYEDAESTVRAILRAITFDHYFGKAQNVSFQAIETGSGLANFTYEIVELDTSGAEISTSMHSGSASATDKIALSLNKNYKIKVKAVDVVGNSSDESIETVSISDVVAQLSVEAKHNGVAYDGTTWVSSAVDFKVTSSSTSGVSKYQYATDGVTFTDFTNNDGTISLPAVLANQKNVTYTFRALNKDGTSCDKTFTMKLDKEKPVIQVKGTVEGINYDGSVVDKDVSLIPYQTIGNISGITYYYTTDASSKDSDPLSDSNWKAYGTELKHTTNGTVTYYFKGVSGAGLSSDPVDYQVQIANKAITIDVELNKNGKYEKDVSIQMGDTLPTVRVVSEDTGVDITSFGTPTFTYTKAGNTVQNPAIEEGIYIVSASYPDTSSASSYNITYKTATLRVNGVTLDPSDYGDYFTITSNSLPYTVDTWTKDPIVITPIHDNFNRLDINDAGTPSSSAYTYQIEGNNNVKLSFYTPEGAKISVTLVLKYDKSKPVMQANSYVDDESRIRSMLRSITFNKYFQKAQKVSFNALDTGSGVASYQYEIIELDANGLEIPSSKTSGNASLHEQLSLSNNKKYKIKVKAVDAVGNISDEQIETVSLSDQVAQLQVIAKNKGIVYDGTTWVHSAIDFSLHSTSVSGVDTYQYSTDGVNFTNFTSSDGTITLPSPVINQNNVTYTFRANNHDGTTIESTFQVKLDSTKPVLSVQSSVDGNPYDGSAVEKDILITPSQSNTNISGIVYYYTTNDVAKDTNPTTDANWRQVQGSITHSRSGTTTYYFKGVSGAGLISDVVSQKAIIVKKEYTPISVQVTSQGSNYTSGAWAKHDITFTLTGGLKDTSQITGYEYTTTNGSRPTSSATWKSINGSGKHVETQNIKNQTYWFRVLPVDPNASLSSPMLVNLDVDTPSVPTLQLKEINTSPIARFINAMSFGNWLNKEIEVVMNASDSTSGVAYYEYDEDNSGTPKKNTSGAIQYSDEVNLTLKAKACDKAGNCSSYSSEEHVMIDQVAPIIQGVQDQSTYKQYYLPRFLEVSDAGSGIKNASYKKDSEAAVPFTKEVKIKGTGTYLIDVEDQAGNTTSLSFKIVPLPDIDTEIDGSDESKEIIDQIQSELDENRDNLDQTEIDDTNKWIEDALNKWEEQRKKVVEDKEQTSKVEGEGDTTFDPKVELIVEEIPESTLPSLPRRAKYSYDVYLKKGNVVIQPNGQVKVYLPYPDSEAPIVYEIDNDGNIKELQATKEGEFVVFVTDSLMKYAISNTKQEVIDETIKVPGPDGKLDSEDDVIAKPSPDGDKPIKKPDGSVDVPPGGSVVYPDGSVIETPDGGILKPDGTLILPDGTEIDPDGNKKPDKPEDETIKVPGPDGKDDTADDVIASPNPDGDRPIKKPDGSVVVPPGGNVIYPDGSVIPTPEGGILQPDGSLTLPDGTQFDPEGNKKPDKSEDEEIKVPGPDGKDDTADDVIAKPSPDGDKPIKKPDGSVSVPPGGSVVYPDGSIIETPDGGILKPDGSLTLPDGTQYDPDGNKKPRVCNIKDTYLNIDTDNDQRPDLNIDLDDDCIADINIDIDDDGIPDLDIDSTGDGKPDLNIDDDSDGRADRNLVKLKYWKPELNVNSPMQYDTMNNIPKEWMLDDGDNSNGGSNSSGSVNGSYTNSDTGDLTRTSFWWVIVVINAIVVVSQIKKLRKRKA